MNTARESMSATISFLNACSLGFAGVFVGGPGGVGPASCC
jgi:hypothetical protein